ncbi:MAG: hypothetical protein AB2604_10565 [Candidatus Thiodiazotropha taylori]
MLKLNINRTFTVPVKVPYVGEDGESHEGEFTAKFKILPEAEAKKSENVGKRLLELVVVEVSDLELVDKDENAITGEALRAAAIGDPTLSSAMVQTYWENAAKKHQAKI